VLTGKLVARDLKDRLGVGSDAVRTNANADAWSVNAPFTPEQHAQVEAERTWSTTTSCSGSPRVAT